MVEAVRLHLQDREIGIRVVADQPRRHRAAIGLTEENDSIAIVVSEETGSISLVVDGQIERGITADDLRSRLREIVINRATRGRRRMKAA